MELQFVVWRRGELGWEAGTVTTHIVVICLKIHTRLQSRNVRRCVPFPSPHDERPN